MKATIRRVAPARSHAEAAQRVRRLESAVVALKDVRELVWHAPHLKARIDAALRSAGGAIRHAEGMENRFTRQ